MPPTLIGWLIRLVVPHSMGVIYRLVFATASFAMTSKSQQPEARDGTLSTLNVAIDVMNFAKGVSVIAPAQAVFGSVSAILTMIRVHSSLFCCDRLLIQVYPGFIGQRRGLCQSRSQLRRYLQCPQSGSEREEAGRPQLVHARCDKPANDVGSTSGTPIGRP